MSIEVAIIGGFEERIPVTIDRPPRKEFFEV